MSFTKTVAANEIATISCGACLVAKFTASDTLGITDSGAPISGTAMHYMVVAGGGGGSSARDGGGGAGGLRSSFDTINGTKGQQLHLSPGPYAVTVGGGGTVGSPGPNQATPGNNSVFSGITATGGGASDTQVVLVQVLIELLHQEI